VSRQLFNEASGVLYGENTLSIRWNTAYPIERWRSTHLPFAKAWLPLIRTVELALVLTPTAAISDIPPTGWLTKALRALESTATFCPHLNSLSLTIEILGSKENQLYQKLRTRLERRTGVSRKARIDELEHLLHSIAKINRIKIPACAHLDIAGRSKGWWNDETTGPFLEVAGMVKEAMELMTKKR